MLPCVLIFVPVERGELAKWGSILMRVNPSMVRLEGNVYGVDEPGWCPIPPRIRETFNAWKRLCHIAFVGQAVLAIKESLALYRVLQIAMPVWWR